MCEFCIGMVNDEIAIFLCFKNKMTKKKSLKIHTKKHVERKCSPSSIFILL